MLDQYLCNNDMFLLQVSPTTIYVMWNLSLNQKQLYLNTFSIDSLDDSYPILKVTNLTNNTDFCVSISDFSNSYFIKNVEANSKYKVELGRIYNDKYYMFMSTNAICTQNNKPVYSDFVTMYNLKDNTRNIVRVPILLRQRFSENTSVIETSSNPSSNRN